MKSKGKFLSTHLHFKFLWHFYALLGIFSYWHILFSNTQHHSTIFSTAQNSSALLISPNCSSICLHQKKGQDCGPVRHVQKNFFHRYEVLWDFYMFITIVLVQEFLDLRTFLIWILLIERKDLNYHNQRESFFFSLTKIFNFFGIFDHCWALF